jgi:signal transduction histidine kinase
MRSIIRRKAPEETADKKLRHLNQTLVRQMEEETEKRLLQERLLIQQSRMAAMGEMIGVIAHQWRQPLNALAVMVQNIQDAYEFGELDQPFIEDVVHRSMQQIHHMSKTIDDFSDFSRSGTSHELFNVRKAINDVLVLLSGLFSAHDIVAACICESDAGMSVNIKGCCNEFKQAMFNLLKNAHDAIQERRKQGRLDRQGRIVIAIKASADRVCISVTDNGGGIPSEIVDRIFDPYFSTKEQGKGSGVGLYMSKLIIENSMKGSLYAHNLQGGAMFAVELAIAG